MILTKKSKNPRKTESFGTVKVEAIFFKIISNCKIKEIKKTKEFSVHNMEYMYFFHSFKKPQTAIVLRYKIMTSTAIW